MPKHLQLLPRYPGDNGVQYRPEPPNPGGLDAEVDALLASATPGSIGNASLTASTANRKVLSLRHAGPASRIDRTSARTVALSTVIDQRRQELAARMGNHPAGSALLAASRPPVPLPKPADVPPAVAFANRMAALQSLITKTDKAFLSPPPTKTPDEVWGTQGPGLLEAARSAVAAFQALPAGGPNG